MDSAFDPSSPLEVVRIVDMNLIPEIFQVLWPTLSEPDKVLLLQNLQTVVSRSPYNGKFLSSERDVNLVRALLGLLRGTNSLPLFNALLSLVRMLASYHLDGRQLKCYFRVMAHIASMDGDAMLPTSRYFSMVQALQQATEGAGGEQGKRLIRPAAFFDFDGLHKKSAITVTKIAMNFHSFSFACWFRAETFLDPANPSGYRPRLFSFSSDQKEHLEGYFLASGPRAQDGAVLVVDVAGKTGWTPWSSSSTNTVLNYQLLPQRWYHICVCHVVPRLIGDSCLLLYVNGVLVCQKSGVKFPKFGAQPFDYCYLGSNLHSPNPTAASFCGQMGNVQLFRDSLKAEEVEILFRADPAVAVFPKDVQKPLVFAYSPLACDGRYAYDINVESLARPQGGAVFLNGSLCEGTLAIGGRPLRESFFTAGGIDLILTLFEIPFVHSNPQLLASLETDVEVQAHLGHHTGALLTFVAELLQGNGLLQREMNQTTGFSKIHALMKRSAPFNLSNPVVYGSLELLKVCFKTPILKDLAKDFLFDFSLWCTGSYQFTVHYLVSLHQEVTKHTSLYREVIGVSHLLDIFKAYFWVLNQSNAGLLDEIAPKVQQLLPQRGSLPFRRFAATEVLDLRRNILNMIKTMVIHDVQEEDIAAVMSLLLFPRDLYQEDVLHMILQLLVYSKYSPVILSYFEKEGCAYAFLHLLTKDNEQIRSLALRVLGVLISTGNRRLWKNLNLPTDDGIFDYILGQLLLHDPSTCGPPTFLSLFEVITGNITDSLYNSKSLENCTGIAKRKCAERRFLATLFALVQVCPVSVRDLVLRQLVLPFMQLDGNVYALARNAGFAGWLETLEIGRAHV